MALTPAERARRKKYTDFMRASGRGVMVPRGPVVKHVEKLEERLLVSEIARRAGVSKDTIWTMRYRQRHWGDSWMRRDTAEKIMAVHFLPEDLTMAEIHRGVRRICEGLRHRGFSFELIAPMIGVTRTHLAGCAQPGGKHRGLAYETYSELIKVAYKLETVQPEDFGLSQRQISVTKKFAAKFPDIAYWDLDYVHEEDAFADTTGRCGTNEGYGLHRSEFRRMGITGAVECEPCKRAHTEYSKSMDSYKSHKGIKIADIREFQERGWSPSRIAAELGCTERTVYRKLEGK